MNDYQQTSRPAPDSRSLDLAPDARPVKTIATSASAFVGQVLWLVALLVAASSAAGFFSRDLQLSGGLALVVMIGWFALTFVVHAVKDIKVLNFVTVFAHAGLSGVMVAPIIRAYGLDAALQAIVITGGVALILGAFALTTKYDFSGWYGYLFAGLIALVVAQLAGVFFFPGLIASPIFATLGAILFSMLLVFDLQRIKKTEVRTEGNAIVGALQVYLDLLNLFLFILRIFGRR